MFLNLAVQIFSKTAVAFVLVQESFILSAQGVDHLEHLVVAALRVHGAGGGRTSSVGTWRGALDRVHSGARAQRVALRM